MQELSEDDVAAEVLKVEGKYANPDESTMVSSTDNFRTSSIKIQQSQIVDFDNFLDEE